MIAFIPALIIIGSILTAGWLTYKMLGWDTQTQKSGNNSINIQSSESDNNSTSVSGGVSITNKNGHIRIKGKVGSVTVNGRKIYA